MVFKTNINTDVAIDEVRSAFKADKRIWSFDLEKKPGESILTIEGEMESAEAAAKIRSLGFEASLVE